MGPEDYYLFHNGPYPVYIPPPRFPNIRSNIILSFTTRSFK
jgi:hypothetical protein